MQNLHLSDFPFVDLYICLDGEADALYRPSISEKGYPTCFVPDMFVEAVSRFSDYIKCHMEQADDTVEFEAVRCRLSRQKMVDGYNWVCCRRIKNSIPLLRSLGMPSHVSEHLHGLGRRDGLILISGSTGNGKTTTACSLLYDYLNSYGGTGITIEDPVEFILSGHHGESGHCFQMEAPTDDDWALCVKRSLRWSPRYLFVGEIRTPQAAEQILRAATTGHLVISTVHAGSIEESLTGLQLLAERAMGPSASEVLASSITGLVYQQLLEKGLLVRYLTMQDGAADPVRGLIRDRKIGMISTYVDRLEARLSSRAS